MLKYTKDSNFRLLLVITIWLTMCNTIVTLSDKRLCADEKCSQIISVGKGLINYQAGAEGMISFKINAPIRIKSKGIGDKSDIWGIEVNGREGYAPKTFIRETSIYVHDSKLVPVDLVLPKGTKTRLKIQKTTENSDVKSEIQVGETDLSSNNTRENDGTNEKLHKQITETIDATEPSTNEIKEFASDSINEKSFVNNLKVEKTDIKLKSHNNESEGGQSIMKVKEGENSSESQFAEVENSSIEKIQSLSNDVQSTNRTIEAQLVQAQPSQINVDKKNDLGQPTNNSQEVIDHNVHENDAESQPLEKLNVEVIDDDKVNVIKEGENKLQELSVPEKGDSQKLDFAVDSKTETEMEAGVADALEGSEEQDEEEEEDEELANSELNVNMEEEDNEKDEKEENGEGGNTKHDKETDLHENKKPIVDNTENEFEVIDTLPNNETIASKEQQQQQQQQQQIPEQELPQGEEFPKRIQYNTPPTESSPSPEVVLQRTQFNTSPPPDNLIETNTQTDPQIDVKSTAEEISELQPTPAPTEPPSTLPYIDATPTAATHFIDESITLNNTNETIPTNNSSQPFINTPVEGMAATPPNIHASQTIATNLDNLVQFEKKIETSTEPSQGLLQSQLDIEAAHTVTESVTLPSVVPPIEKPAEGSKEKGLFATILGTVNNIWSADKKLISSEAHDHNDELHKILYPHEGDTDKTSHIEDEVDSNLYCDKLGPNVCPPSQQLSSMTHSQECVCSTEHGLALDVILNNFLELLAPRILEKSELLACLIIAAAASLFFIFGYYCFCNSSREGALLSKINQLESTLLASHKENSILKHNLTSTRQKLASIEDNSFSSNDMVAALKRELEEELVEKARLQDQVINLQKELENAADAGIELNRIVSELLSNQSGDESIISSVEELQKQLNEQQNTILEINASLAEKSRENSELQLMIAEQNAQYESKMNNLQRDNDELEAEKSNLLSRIEELRTDFDTDMTAALESKNYEIKRLQNDVIELSHKVESEYSKWQTSLAKVEALEECLKSLKRDPNINITQIIDAANVRAEMLDAVKKANSLKEKFDAEVDARKLAENQLKIVSAEVEKLKQDFNQTEKDKLEAQTRLEVLSNYFKEKETQLQKDLSVKEAMWLKQQGETTTTVDRLTAMQAEIQSLQSQNDSLRAEMEAQIAAHKAQTGTLENRAHETWLAARQADRRYEEARAEATALRRKLTAIAASGTLPDVQNNKIMVTTGEERTSVPSPIHMEAPGSPILGHMPPPPPPPFLPPPFMGPPFMGMPPPPPPFVPTGEMRPAPLGRIMSPPPQRSGRFTPQPDYDDYLEFEGNDNWQRHTYSPPRTYRSLSPTDSRYKYDTERDLISTYDTETDFSPPPSPRGLRKLRGAEHSTRSGNYNNSKMNNKGILSSGSEKSFNSSSHNHQQQQLQQQQQQQQQQQHKGKGSSGGSGAKSFV